SGSTFECRVDEGVWTACTGPHTTSALREGSHTFDVRATDRAGNTDTTPASHTWPTDLGPPTAPIPAAPTHPNEAAPRTHTTAALGEGSHTFDVRATDPAGNTDGTPASHTWSIDLGPPTVTITAPTTYVNGSDPSTYTVAASTLDGDVTHVDFYECSNASV